MEKANIMKYTLRLNLENEQHQRVARILNDLNTDVHKSVNQFMIKALDAYINCFDEEEIVSQPKKTAGYISREDLEEIRLEIKSEVKDEIIRALGSAIIGNYSMKMDNTSHEKQVEKEETNPKVANLANIWG